MGRSHTERLALELASTVRALAACADEKWCESVFLAAFCDGESVEKGAISINPARVAISGELVRVDLHSLDEMPSRLNLGNLLVRELEPFIIGVGEVRVVWHEPFESLVVFRGDPSLVARDHEITPEMIEAGYFAFCKYDSRFEFLEDAVVRIYRAMRNAIKSEARVSVPAPGSRSQDRVQGLTRG